MWWTHHTVERFMKCFLSTQSLSLMDGSRYSRFLSLTLTDNSTCTIIRENCLNIIQKKIFFLKADLNIRRGVRCAIILLMMWRIYLSGCGGIFNVDLLHILICRRTFSEFNLKHKCEYLDVEVRNICLFHFHVAPLFSLCY